MASFSLELGTDEGQTEDETGKGHRHIVKNYAKRLPAHGEFGLPDESGTIW
jgi:hypothetical protein